MRGAQLLAPNHSEVRGYSSYNNCNSRLAGVLGYVFLVIKKGNIFYSYKKNLINLSVNNSRMTSHILTCIKYGMKNME